jgi:hypothetical protein
MPSNKSIQSLSSKFDVAQTNKAMLSASPSTPRTMSRKQQRRLNQSGRSKGNRRQQMDSEEPSVDETQTASPDQQPQMVTTVESQQLPSAEAWARKMHAIARDE